MKRAILFLAASVVASYVLAWLKTQPDTPYRDVTGLWGAIVAVYGLAISCWLFLKEKP